MHLVGKCPPDAESLTAAADRGFDAVELYLTPEHLDDVAETVRTVQTSPVSAASVHTPHARPEEGETFRRADDLAARLDAYLVVHSQYLQHFHVPVLESYDFAADYGYENNPGASLFHLRNTILDRGHELVLDTAHLYATTARYYETLERLLSEYGSQLSVVHLTDGTTTADGLAIGAGEIDLRATTELLDRQFEGTVVLEVMPADQRAGWRRILGWLR